MKDYGGTGETWVIVAVEQEDFDAGVAHCER